MKTSTNPRFKRAGYLFIAAAVAYAVFAALELANHAPPGRWLVEASPAVLFAVAGIVYLRKS
jgi:hypothetical protein